MALIFTGVAGKRLAHGLRRLEGEDFAVYVKFLMYTLRFYEKLTSILTFGFSGAWLMSKMPQKTRKKAILDAKSGCRPIDTSVSSY
ncbi:MAG: hypothetical protein V4542_15150 [Pseudomonadota bacterium]